MKRPETPLPPSEYVTGSAASDYLRVLAGLMQHLTCKVRIDLKVDYATDAELAQRALEAQKRGCRRGKKKP